VTGPNPNANDIVVVDLRNKDIEQLEQ